MTNLKKVFTIVMVLAMVFTMSSVAFADEANPTNDTNAYYYQTDNAAMYTQTGSITVYVTVESNRTNRIGSTCIMERAIPVTLNLPEGADSAKFTVVDALLALQDNEPYASTYELHFQNSSGTDIQSGATYIYQVKQGDDSDVTYGPGSILSFDGWMVRINDRFTIDKWDDSVGGLSGEAIDKMYLKDGDNIHLYMDNTTSSSTCIRFTRLIPSYSDGTLSVTVEESHNYFGSSNPYPWTITDYATYTSSGTISLKIYDDENQVVASFSGTSGAASVSNLNLTSGESYTVVLEHTFKTGSKNLKYTSSYAKFVA